MCRFIVVNPTVISCLKDWLRPKRVTLLVLLLLSAVLVGLPGWSRNRAIDRRVDTCLAEVGDAFETVFTIAPLGGEVFYGYGMADGNELRRVDLETQRHRKVQTRYPIMRVYGPSPGQRFLPFKTVPEYARETADAGVASPERMMVYDRQTEDTFSMTDSRMALGKYILWLSDSTFIFSGTAKTAQRGSESLYVADTTNPGDSRLLAEMFPWAASQITDLKQNVTRLEDMRIAMEEAGEIVVLDLKQSTRQVLSRFGGEFTNLSWLNYSKKNGSFLFCSYRKGETYRNLFRFDPVSQLTTRLTTEHTYNGQWLQDGTGYVYVGNSNNSFYLGVRPAEVAAGTNLFRGGHVERYAVSADGQRVCLVASTNAEPRALWEYDLLTRTTRMLLRGNKTEFRNVSVSTPTEAKVTSSDGLEIPTYLFPPRNEQPGQAYPLVIYLPPRTAQCSRGYEIQAQTLANLGFYYLGVNYRGCDGYGREYAGKWDAQQAAEDVRAVVIAALKDPRFDKRRVCMVGFSESCLVLLNYLELDQGILKAVVMESPVTFDMSNRLTKGSPLPLLVSTGDHDPALGFVRSFEQWAKGNSTKTQFYYIKGFGHPDVTEIRARVDQERETAKFLLKNI